VIGSERRIVQAPVAQVVGRMKAEIPVIYRNLGGDFHPVTLGFKVSVHGRFACAKNKAGE
jgi:hypothetical protein